MAQALMAEVLPQLPPGCGISLDALHRSGERDQQAVAETVYDPGRVPWTAIDLLHASCRHHNSSAAD